MIVLAGIYIWADLYGDLQPNRPGGSGVPDGEDDWEVAGGRVGSIIARKYEVDFDVLGKCCLLPTA